MTPEESNDLSAQVQFLESDVVVLKRLVDLQTAIIGRLFAEIAAPPSDPRARLNEMLVAVEGSFDRHGATRPPNSPDRNLLAKFSNDLIESAELALADILGNRANKK